MDVVFGLDISHHQDRALDLKRVAREGLRFVFLKAGEGGSYVDPEFAANLAEARAAGLLAGAYWFIRNNATPAAHLSALRRTVPLDVPVIPDVELATDKSWPTRPHATACLHAIQAAGYQVPVSYIPLWFWRDYWRKASLAGWPPLWSSRYPDNVVGTLADEWDDVPAHFWDGYGGLAVRVLQFTSSARIAGWAPLDANAFRGTRQQLAALFGDTTPEEETDVALTAADRKAIVHDLMHYPVERVDAPGRTITIAAMLANWDKSNVLDRAETEAEANENQAAIAAVAKDVAGMRQTLAAIAGKVGA